MPEKKSVPEKTTKAAAVKPAVRKTVPKAPTTTVKPASVKKAETKLPAKSPVEAKTKTAPVQKPVARVEAVKPAVVLEEKKPAVESIKPAEKIEAKKSVKGKMLNITLLKSGIGYSKRHKATLRALGFHRLHQTIQKVDSPSLRGMLAKVSHLVRIEEQVTK